MNKTKQKTYQSIVNWMKNNGITRFKDSDVEIVVAPEFIGTPFMDIEAAFKKRAETKAPDAEPDIPVMEDPWTYGTGDPNAVPRIKRQ